MESIVKEAYSQAYPESAICVQRFDDSLNSAIRITYRISLRSSSLREPRYPLYRVVFGWIQRLGRLHINFRLVLFGVNVDKDQLGSLFV